MSDIQIALSDVRANIDDVQARIDAACARAGRSANEITLIAVSKTFPIEAIDVAHDAGLRHFGENKVQELTAKAEQRPGEVEGGDRRWHMIGHLQRNKARDVVAAADFFDALDSPRLAKELEKRCRQAERVLPCLVQVNVSGEDSKYGFAPETLYPFLDAAGRYEHLQIAGLMTLAEPADDPEDVRPQFRLLRELAEGYAGRGPDNVDLRRLSMGMSGDFEVAIEEGATHVRIGSALFGPRTY